MNSTSMINRSRHKEWRKIAKRERRRRIRTFKAKERDYLPPHEYEKWCKDQESLELIELEQIEKSNQAENDKWLKAEQVALEQWKKIQLQKELLHREKLQQQAKLKLEWETEEEKRKSEVERLKEIEEENRKRQEVFMDNLNKFLNGDLVEPPKELLILYETKPNSAPCPFFTKTACCRFGDECSRNHKYPGISKVLLAANMFGHFGLENANFNEYDTDIMLEYEDSDTYKEFKDFFFDILPEFQKFGKVVELKVCNNYEKHLRGNTYIEYADIRSAVQAYRTLHSRWYGGKQLSLQFCELTSWNNAMCGLQSSKRCPKGRACNFLHVFRNPIKLFVENRNSERPKRTPSRSWRWSESPERESPRHKDKERYCSKDHDRRRHRHRSHRSSSSRNRDR
ncbi:U2 small nuclear ribonucleoprotein auxiliary factor 35 kDa subunit-related protein 2 [Melitaea cinxia]|uniref:U2 small nuclear ribonucleoprotein auxiliary factor 35 kDa subunit-related protein 2 n=1 Tax=Melitaea cinxia TaxID=113334 RepID=UPI001E26F725|nr:U2 small nuclear ribonucleoprotein auxiliary factor 35 kDa subunit-related protein 2 [Melitaea cinxia]